MNQETAEAVSINSNKTVLQHLLKKVLSIPATNVFRAQVSNDVVNKINNNAGMQLLANYAAAPFGLGPQKEDVRGKLGITPTEFKTLFILLVAVGLPCAWIKNDETLNKRLEMIKSQI